MHSHYCGSAWASWHFPKTFQPCKKVIELLVCTPLQLNRYVKWGGKKQKTNCNWDEQNEKVYIRLLLVVRSQSIINHAGKLLATQRENLGNEALLSSNVIRVFCNQTCLVCKNDWRVVCSASIWVDQFLKYHKDFCNCLQCPLFSLHFETFMVSDVSLL